MTDWFKQLQSASRGFRPGIEVKVMTAANNVGKTLVVDFESDDFKPWRVSLWPHYAEYRDYETGETHWEKFDRQPKIGVMRLADNIIRKNDDGSYEYIKNRETGELRKLTEKEAMWLILKVGA